MKAEPYRKLLDQGAQEVEGLVDALDLDGRPLNLVEVRRLAGAAYRPIDRVVCAESAARSRAEERGMLKLGIAIDCRRCFGTGPLHTCALCRTDAVRVVKTKFYDDGGAMRSFAPSFDELVGLLRDPMNEALRRMPLGGPMWERWGAQAFKEGIDHAAHEIRRVWKPGMSFGDALDAYIVEEQRREGHSHAVGHLSQWRSHHLTTAWVCLSMIGSYLSAERGVREPLQLAARDARRAQHAIAAIAHEDEALAARRAFADQAERVEVSAAALWATEEALAWDGHAVVAIPVTEARERFLLRSRVEA